MNDRYTIFVNDGIWRIACVAGDRAQVQVLPVDTAADAEAQEKANAAAALIGERGGAGPVVIALASDWCPSAVIDTHGLSRSNRRQAMRYLLEEQLPVSAEDSVADFVQHDGSAIGVASELKRLRPIVEALEALDSAVKQICPGALLSAAELIERYPGAACVAIKGRAGIDLVDIHNTMPARWWWLADESALHERLALYRESRGDESRQIVTLGIGPVEGFETVDADLDDADTHDAEARGIESQNAEHFAAIHASRLLLGEVSPWIDLRRDAMQAQNRYELFHKQAGALVAALAFFLVCVIGATYWRGQQYKEGAQEMVAKQINVYKQAMPGQRVPASIISRMQSEQRRLAGLSGQTGSSDAAGGEALHPVSALTHLHTLVTAWPGSLRYRVLDLTIEPDLVRVNGQAPDSVIPEKLAAQLRTTGGYEVDPPNTRALSDFGFSFGFTAKPAVRVDDANDTPKEPGL